MSSRTSRELSGDEVRRLAVAASRFVKTDVVRVSRVRTYLELFAQRSATLDWLKAQEHSRLVVYAGRPGAIPNTERDAIRSDYTRRIIGGSEEPRLAARDYR